jgi:hypothetical protein
MAGFQTQRDYGDGNFVVSQTERAVRIRLGEIDKGAG